MRPLLFLPGPSMVPDEILASMLKEPVGHRSKEFHEVYSSTVSYLKEVFKTENPVYIFTASGTGGVEAALANVVAPEDRVLVPVYGEFSRRMGEIAKIYSSNVITRRVEFPKCEDIISLIHSHENIDLLLIVYNDTCPGLTLRGLDRITKVAKDSGIMTVVDAISILGGDRLEMDKWGIDVTIAASQKCLASPPGLSFVAMSEDALGKVREVPRRTYYFDIKEYIEFDKRKEVPFTPAVNIMYALNKALSIILENIGLERWISYHEERAKALIKSLGSMGLNPAVPTWNISNTVISTTLPQGLKPAEIIEYLSKEYSIFIADGIGEWKGSILRIGNMGWINKTELYMLVTALADALNKLGNKRIDIDRALNLLKIIHFT